MAFSNFALNYVRGTRNSGEMSFGRLPTQAPPTAFNNRVAISTCGHPFRSGWYTLESLVSPTPGHPKTPPNAPLRDLSDAAQTAGFIVVDPQCSASLPPQFLQRFHEPYTFGAIKYYVRKLGN
jgi:hypothetical protein